MWHALRVKSTKERDVTQALRSEGIRAVFAGKRKQHRKGGTNKAHTCHEVYCEIPGYVFAELTPSQFDRGRLGLGVEHVYEIIGHRLGWGRAGMSAQWINEDVIKLAKFRDDLSEEVLFIRKDSKRALTRFLMSELVRICDGPFDGHEGKVIKQCGSSVLIEHGRLGRLSLSAKDLQKVG
jgi:transcription antitermination factor NusG